MHISKINWIYFLSGIAVAIIFLFFIGILTGKGSNRNLNLITDAYPQGYHIVSPPIPDEPEFAGEIIPIDNFDVYERLDREFLVNSYWHSATILAIKRANRWFPVIEPILKRNNIPDDFKYLSVIESNLENVVSYAGAAGFWQFTEETGKKYGLEINDEIDERYNLEKATEAACKYLQDSYSIFGNWVTSAASYNVGQDGILKQMDRQKAKKYFNLSFNQETYRFVARIIAMKYIMNNPESYGYELKPDELYKPLEYYEITVNSPIPEFSNFAVEKGINYLTLKLYNPWLRDTSLKNKYGKAYIIKLPKEGSINLVKE